MRRPSVPLAPNERILLVRLGAIGDVVRTLPALHHIRKTLPSAWIAWIVEDLSRELLEGHPEIDEVIPFPRRELSAARSSLPRRLRALAALRRNLRARRFGAALDFQGSLKSALVAALSGARRRIGFAPGHCREMSYLLTNEWVRPRSRWLNRVEKNLVLAAATGGPIDEATLILPERSHEGDAAEVILRDAAPAGEPVVVISPGTSRRQRHKRWSPAGFGRLAALVRASGRAVPLVVWGPDEARLAGTVVAASAGAARLAPAIGLRTLAALLRRSAVFVGADTGPMHLAWAVGCPVVALFGPTDPRLNSPLGERDMLLRNASATAAIEPEEVFDAVRRVLDGSRTARGPAAAPRLSRSLLARPGSGSTP